MEMEVLYVPLRYDTLIYFTFTFLQPLEVQYSLQLSIESTKTKILLICPVLD